MSSIINASTSSGLVSSADLSGTLELQANGSTKLTVNSTGAVLPNGLTVAGNGPAFSAYAGSTTSLGNAVYTKVLFDTEEFDTNNNFASSRFTPTVAGYYQLTTCIAFSSSTTNETVIAIYKNGSIYKYLIDVKMSNIYYLQGTCLVSANGSTDYFEVYVYQSSGGTINSLSGQAATYFQASMTRSA